METIDHLLLDLYRMARDLPAATFQEKALQSLEPHLKFVSAIWGAGRLSHAGIKPYAMHTHNVDPDAPVHWSHINRQDKVIPIIDAHRGQAMRFHAPSLFYGRSDTVMRDYAARYGRQSYMITAFPSSNPEMFRWLSLYRPNPDAQYSERERSICEGLMSHFAQALEINQSISRLAMISEERDASVYLALVDQAGTVHFAQEGFLKLLHSEWSETDDCILPGILMTALRDSTTACFIGRYIRCEGRLAGDMILLRSRLLSRLDSLSPRRYSIARLYASGQSHKEIAKQLNISPATVRNHLAACFRELAITSKAELTALALAKGGKP